MEFHEYVAVIRRSWIILLGSAVLGVAGAALYLALVQPSYEAKTQVYVSVPASESTTISELQEGASYARQAVASYARLATSTRILDQVLDEMAFNSSSELLAPRVEAFAAVGTGLINITVAQPEPRAAADIANSIAGTLRDFIIRDANGPSADVPGVVAAQVTQVAAIPSQAVDPNKPLAIVLGLMFGLAIGVSGAFLRNSWIGQQSRSGAPSVLSTPGADAMERIQ